MNLFMGISFFFIAINMLAIVLLLKMIVFILTHDPGAVRMDGLKSMYSASTLENIGQWILGHFSDFYLLLLVFFFYSVTYLKNKAIFNALLLVSSLTTIVNGLMSGGRTQMIYWILVFISCFIYFRKDMPATQRKKVTRFSVVLFSLFVVYLAAVTIFRFQNAFSGATEYAEVFSLLDYSGQIFLNFNDFFSNLQHNDFTIARIFPFTYDWIHDTNFDLVVYKRSIKMDIGIFSTFLGDFYIDIGIIGTVLYAMVFIPAAFFVQRSIIPASKKFQQVLLFFLLFQVPLNGLFYYSLYNKTAMISVIGTIIISLMFKFSEKETIEVADTTVS